MTLDASIRPPDSSAIFCVTVFDVSNVALPSDVAAARFLTMLSLFSSELVIDAIFATISSTAAEDCTTLADWLSMLPFKVSIVRIISSTVPAVSVTLAA